MDYLTTKSSSIRLTRTGGRASEPKLLSRVVIHNSPGLRSKMYGYDSDAFLSWVLANTTGSVHVLQSSSEKAMDTSALCQLAITSLCHQLAITWLRSPPCLGKLLSPSGYSRFQTSAILPLDRLNRWPGALLASIWLGTISLQ